jgi:hypothetical protein
MLTQAELHSILHYDYLTGLFTRFKGHKICGYMEKKGYIAICVKTKTYKAHRLAWLYVYGEMPKNQIDHINGIKDDNRIDNLREATASENMFNRLKFKNSKSPIKGISFHIGQQKWTAKIQLNKKRLWLGSYNTFEEAAVAYKNAAIELHGNFINLG